MDGKVLDQRGGIIATLPSLEEARAKIVGILSSCTKIGSILLAPGSKIANLSAKSLKNNYKDPYVRFK